MSLCTWVCLGVGDSGKILYFSCNSSEFTLHIESLVCIILALLNFDVLNLFKLFRSCSHAFGFNEYFFASRGGRQLESV